MLFAFEPAFGTCGRCVDVGSAKSRNTSEGSSPPPSVAYSRSDCSTSVGGSPQLISAEELFDNEAFLQPAYVKTTGIALPPGLEEWSLLKARSPLSVQIGNASGLEASPSAMAATARSASGIHTRRFPPKLEVPDAFIGIDVGRVLATPLRVDLAVETTQPQSEVPPPPPYSPVFASNFMKDFASGGVNDAFFNDGSYDSWRPSSLDGVLAALGLEADDGCSPVGDVVNMVAAPPLLSPTLPSACNGFGDAIPPPPNAPFVATMDSLVTAGSAGHAVGTCKPCAFFYSKGCESGVDCKFCHLCPIGEKKRRRKERASAWQPSKPELLGKSRR